MQIGCSELRPDRRLSSECAKLSKGLTGGRRQMPNSSTGICRRHDLIGNYRCRSHQPPRSGISLNPNDATVVSAEIAAAYKKT